MKGGKGENGKGEKRTGGVLVSESGYGIFENPLRYNFAPWHILYFEDETETNHKKYLWHIQC